MAKLSHLDEKGQASMVDVSAKEVSVREAVAEGRIILRPETLALIQEGGLPKGDVLAVARIAGIQAAKQTSALIPLCHSLPLTKVAVGFEVMADGVRIEALAKTTAQTGVEMEALAAVSVAALTIYDMCKAVDKEMRIEGVTLVKKTKDPVAR